MEQNKITIDTDYPFPSTRDLEVQLLAELITDSCCMFEVIGIINETVFSDKKCLHLWRNMVERYNKNLTIDLVTALEMTDKDFLVNEILPHSRAYSGAMRSIAEHATLLRLSAARRTAYTDALKIVQLSSTSGVQYAELLALVEKMGANIKGFLNEGVKSSALADIVNELAEDIERAQADRESGKPTRIPTGFPSLDELTYSGFAPGNLVILSARPSVGKTAVMLQMAKSAAVAGFTPSIFNLEMGNKELAQRLLVGTGHVSQSEIAHGTVNWDEIEKGIAEVSSHKMYLYDDKRTLEEISTQIVLNHHQGRCSIAFIDYLGLISTMDNKPLYQVISNITKSLKQLAMDCGIPIVLLCQLNRLSAIEDRPPQLSDLRDSGSIEQDADIVLMLEREGEDDECRRYIDMWVRKNRQARAGDIYIAIDADESFNNFDDKGKMEPGLEPKQKNEDQKAEVQKSDSRKTA